LVSPTPYVEQIRSIISGNDYHGTIASLAMKFQLTGMKDAAAVELLRSLMESSAAPRDDRWQARYAEIPRAVSTAREKIGERLLPVSTAGGS
jgi:hypothetical protein